MPILPKKTNILLGYLKLLLWPNWIMPKPIYAAAGLILVASILTTSVIYSLKEAGTVPPGVNGYALVDESEPAPPTEPAVIKHEPAVKPAADTMATGAKAAISRSYDTETPRWPVRGAVSLDFGWQQHPVYHDWRYHNGIDIKAAEGQPVQAVFGGEVQEIYNDKNYGQTAVVKSGRYTVIYGSLGSLAVNKGDTISNGSKIGVVGSFTAEPGMHLHLAIKDGDKYINPLSLLK